MSATFAISSCAFQVSNVTPQLDSADRAWATQAGMMLSWKDGKSIGGYAAAAIADSVAPQTGVFAVDYANAAASGCAERHDCSISLPDYIDFLARLGITERDTNPNACGLSARLRKYGPMTIVVGTPTTNHVHAEILTGVTGSSTNGGAAVNIIDPDTGNVSSLSLKSLAVEIEAAVAEGWPEFVQFP